MADAHLDRGTGEAHTEQETAAVARDLEMMRICAVAVGEVVREYNGYLFFYGPQYSSQQRSSHYNPLKNDAQAMALVKRFRLAIGTNADNKWIAFNADFAETPSDDLNRAIVECVAKMRATAAVSERQADNAQTK